MSQERSAAIRLDYYEQGDDMSEGIVRYPDGTVDIKTSFNNHIALLQRSIDKLETVKNALMAEDTSFDIEADMHYINVVGDTDVIKRLENNAILSNMDSDEDEPLLKEVDALSVENNDDSDYNSDDVD
jgi:hypothetical protein